MEYHWREIWDHDGERWEIYRGDIWDAEVIWSMPCDPAQEDEQGRPPAALRAEYERLIGRGEFIPESEAEGRPVNLVEMVSDEDCGFDQPCAHGYRVEQHAVYCHNETWLYAPRKCHRREDWPHSDCPGYTARQTPA